LEVGLAIGIGVVRVVAKDAGRDQRLRGYVTPIVEDPLELDSVDREAHRLPQLARALAARRTDDRIVHVEADVEDRGLDALRERHPARRHRGRDLAPLHRAVEALLDDPRGIVVALQELVEARDVLLVEAEVDAIEEWERPSEVLGTKQAILRVSGLPDRGI